MGNAIIGYIPSFLEDCAHTSDSSAATDTDAPRIKTNAALTGYSAIT